MKGTQREQSQDTFKHEENRIQNTLRKHFGMAEEDASSQIAPWINDGPPMLNTYEINASNFLSNGPDGLQTSPNSPKGVGRSTADESHSDSGCPRADDRRPSAVSDATVSSQNSTSKASAHKNAAHKKLAGIFSDDGRQSSRGSENSIPNSLQRETTQTSQNGSIQSSYTDGRPLSPNSSRPRSPLPSSDVTPWLFQDFKVSPRRNASRIGIVVLHVSSMLFMDPGLCKR